MYLCLPLKLHKPTSRLYHRSGRKTRAIIERALRFDLGAGSAWGTGSSSPSICVYRRRGKREGRATSARLFLGSESFFFFCPFFESDRDSKRGLLTTTKRDGGMWGFLAAANG